MLGIITPLVLLRRVVLHVSYEGNSESLEYIQLEPEEVTEIERRHAQENLDRGQVDMPGGWPILT